MDADENPNLEEMWEAVGFWKIIINDRVYYFHTYNLRITN